MDSVEQIERKKQQAEEVARRFDAMAARIRHNGTDQFGGAFVLVPPNNAGNAVEVLQLADSNPGLFWMLVKAQVDEQYKQMQDMAARMQYGSQR